MARATSDFRCTECGWTSIKWVGRCGECQAWGTVEERGAPKVKEVRAAAPSARAQRISQVSTESAQRRRTGIAELDRVLGDGLVPGAVVLLAGEPGVGKSTLLLDVAAKWAGTGQTTLYISGEESVSQVKLRAERTGAVQDSLFLAAETDLSTVLGHVEQVQPTLLVVDSAQTIATAEADGAPGGPAQVREVTGALVRAAKAWRCSSSDTSPRTAPSPAPAPWNTSSTWSSPSRVIATPGFAWCAPPRTATVRPTRWAASR